MSSILDLLGSQLGPDAIGAIANQLGADTGSTRNAVGAALPMLVTALAKNASQDTGASALHGALMRDHDGSILDDVLGAVTSQATASTGNGILKHVLGAQRSPMEQALSQVSGLNAGQGGQLLQMLAPLVLGALGRQARGSGLDAGSLASMLGQQGAQARQAMPQQASLLTSLLDKDGDGSIADDVGRIGLGMLGGLFNKKP